MTDKGQPVTAQPGYGPPAGQPPAYGQPPGYGQPGQPQYGQPGPGGQPQYGHPGQGGQPQYGQPQYGHPGGQPQYGQPGPGGQPQYGQPGPGGQPQYGQPGPGGQPQYGQPGPGGQPQYGQPAYGQPAQFGAPVPGQPPLPPGTQPVVWMNRPQAISGCPPGLEYLTQIDQLLVKQQVELFEMFTSWETSNKYKISNSMGQQIYFAAEESDTCMRQCCGPHRGFVMHITDNMGQEVIRVTREFKCCTGCGCCAHLDGCAYTVTVEAPPGEVVGYVKQQFTMWTPKYSVLDANGELVFNIKGPCCICQGICCTWDQDFKVFSPDWMTEVGKISKQWSGLLREMYTDADNFGVNFPVDLNVKIKAVLIGAVFLIDFMFFEQKQNNNNR